ncbi:MAG: DNA-3-methyladenine glycosylase 2 family protein [Clostridia bacterium]|nr:DNA-3-methyladenine glycosylase 2 family protein [Clostridia bacterium]
MTNTDKYSVCSRELDGVRVVVLEGVDGFDVTKTFDCGQCFRFEPVENSRHEQEFAGVAHGRLISVAQDGNTLYIYNADEADYNNIWRRYLGLDTDYDRICEDILSRSDNAALAEAVRVGRGIRILRQQPWETVCSFIISQNNNIPRIKKIIAAMSEKYGERIDARGMQAHGAPSGEAYTFPTAESLLEAGVEGVFALKTGFRAKYIIDAAQKCTDGTVDLAALYDLPTAEAVEVLKSIKGIGNKVAACSLLFGFDKLDAFPVDVWIKRVIFKYFDCDGDFNSASLGPYAGVAQQYLFYYERYLN